MRSSLAVSQLVKLVNERLSHESDISNPYFNGELSQPMKCSHTLCRTYAGLRYAIGLAPRVTKKTGMLTN